MPSLPNKQIPRLVADSHHLSNRQLASKYGIGPTQVANILRAEEEQLVDAQPRKKTKREIVDYTDEDDSQASTDNEDSEASSDNEDDSQASLDTDYQASSEGGDSETTSDSGSEADSVAEMENQEESEDPEEGEDPLEAAFQVKVDVMITRALKTHEDLFEELVSAPSKDMRKKIDRLKQAVLDTLSTYVNRILLTASTAVTPLEMERLKPHAHPFRELARDGISHAEMRRILKNPGLLRSLLYHYFEGSPK
jgi:cobalamin biosynthesis protein CobT